MLGKDNFMFQQIKPNLEALKGILQTHITWNTMSESQRRISAWKIEDKGEVHMKNKFKPYYFCVFISALKLVVFNEQAHNHQM